MSHHFLHIFSLKAKAFDLFDVAFVGETRPQGLEYPSPKFQQENVLSSPTKKPCNWSMGKTSTS